MNLFEQKKNYDADGFLKIDDFVSEQRLQELEVEMTRYTREIVPQLPPGDIVYETDASTGATTGIRNLWRMEKHSPCLHQFGRQEPILELVGALVKGEPRVMAVELFAKPARVGSAVP